MKSGIGEIIVKPTHQLVKQWGFSQLRKHKMASHFMFPLCLAEGCGQMDWLVAVSIYSCLKRLRTRHFTC